ncbi:hypothetical protein [Streptomyces xantholiticus]|uniref:hypothetical protein n=1 Tax=Streptomyces xantholiticus TaxID=68285 RepID=UPI0016729924|nr:hypothetical protein [Streptomyces xantholiticus]
MSMPQNPYGQQPNPYGQPQYPQQPGHPQPGYGQQPHPAAGGWGGPPPYGPPPVPPRKNRTGLTLTLALGAIPLILLLVWFGNSVDLHPDDAGGGSEFPVAEYELTTPKTLLDGKYELADDQSAQRQQQLESSPVDESSIRDPQATVAQYTSTSEGRVRPRGTSVQRLALRTITVRA